MVAGGKGLFFPRPPPGCIRLPYLYIKYQEGGGKRGAAPSLSPLAYAPPTYTNETRSTYLPVAPR